MSETDYYVHSRNGKPWILLRTRTFRCCRWIPHLQKWAELPDLWDMVSGHSSDSMGADRVTVEEAMSLLDVVDDLPDEYVAGHRVFH